MIYKMKLADSVDEMIFDLLEVPIEDKDIEGTADNTTIDGNVFTDYLWLKKQFVQKWSLMCEDDYTQLRGFYTRQWENAEVPTYKLFVGENRSETLTASGSAFQIQNGTQYDAPLTLTELTGNATQTTYSGKNLIENTHATGSTTSNGMTFTTNSDGTITLNGTATALTWYVFHSEQLDLPDGTYTISLQGGTGTNIGIYNDKFGNTLLGSSTTRAITNASGNVSIRVASGATASNLIVKPMIESGSSMTAYEPYVGGTPAPNPSFPMPISVVTGENVVKITGKNLFDKSAITSGKLIDRNTGVLNNQSSYATSDFMLVQAGKRYTFTGFNYWYAVGFDKNKNYLTTLPNYATYTIPDGVAYIRAGLLLTNLDTAQFEQNDRATAYEPYQGQEYEVNLGKNLFDKNSVTTGKILNRTDGTLENNASYDTSDFMPVKAGEKYTYTGFNVWYASYYDANKAFVSTPNNSTTITIPTGVAYVRCSLLHTNLDTAQFEHGTQATSYEELYNYELAKIGNYQDRIYKEDSKWYIEKQVGKVVLNGTETWSKTTNANGLTYFYTLKSDRLAGNDVISDTFTNIATWTAQTNIDAINGSGGNTAINIMLSDTTISTADAFKAWLGTHNTTVYYALATPTTTEITDSTLLSQLNFIANLYGGTNNITLVGTGAHGEIGVEYTLTYEKEQVIIPETPVRLNLTDGGVINTCGCRQNVQLTMRETVQ